MAVYAYRFHDEDGNQHEIERVFKMGEAPESIVVDMHDACYTATRVITAPGLQTYRLGEWAVDLPPVNWNPRTKDVS